MQDEWGVAWDVGKSGLTLLQIRGGGSSASGTRSTQNNRIALVIAYLWSVRSQLMGMLLLPSNLHDVWFDLEPCPQQAEPAQASSGFDCKSVAQIALAQPTKGMLKP